MTYKINQRILMLVYSESAFMNRPESLEQLKMLIQMLLDPFTTQQDGVTILSKKMSDWFINQTNSHSVLSKLEPQLIQYTYKQKRWLRNNAETLISKIDTKLHQLAELRQMDS